MARPKSFERLLGDKDFLEQAKAGTGRFPDLEVWQAAFLSYLEKCNDRVDSAAKAGKLWKEVEESLRDDQSFLDAFEEIDRERIVRLEDGQFREALKNQNAAQVKMALEARSSVYRKKTGTAGKASARPHLLKKAPTNSAESEWSRIFGLTKPAEESHGSQPAADPGVALRDSAEGDELAATGLS